VSQDDEAARLRRVAEYAEQQARLGRWRDDPSGMKIRFRALVQGGPPDQEALEWADDVLHAAFAASFKLWTMYGRGEPQRKSEIDQLMSLLDNHTGPGPKPLPVNHRPGLIVITRVLGDGDRDGNDLVLGPTDWRLVDRRDSTTVLVVAPELEARARELFPGVPVDKAGG
jgi:hypothetical protein